MSKLFLIIYWISTSLLSCIMLYSAFLYFTKTEMIQGFFESFNYPTYIVIPLAILKILGVILIIFRKPVWLSEWAYAGFFFDLVLASAAHFKAGDGIGLSVVGLVLLIASYATVKKKELQ